MDSLLRPAPYDNHLVEDDTAVKALQEAAQKQIDEGRRLIAEPPAMAKTGYAPTVRGYEAGNKPSPATSLEQSEDTLSPFGEIISVAGSRARVKVFDAADPRAPGNLEVPSIGTIIAIDTGHAIVVGLVTSMTTDDKFNGSTNQLNRYLEFDFSGELKREQDGYITAFRRGVSVYPRLGDLVCQAVPKVLEKVYGLYSRDGIEVGHLHQNPSIPAYVKTDEMLGKHFGIVGSTGSGKSCTVALVLQEILERHPNAHIVLLDPHNEYGTCFGERTERVCVDDINLPFWMLNFEETVEILIGNTEGYAEEIEILREMIPVAKQKFEDPKTNLGGSIRRDTASTGERYNVDVPIPYRIADLLDLLEVEMGRFEKTREVRCFKRLSARIKTVVKDPRFRFMFGHEAVTSSLEAVVKRLFRIPVSGRPICVIEMMGMASEVVNVVVSVVARLAFDVSMWSRGKIAITLVCEEAHRYVPRSKEVGFEPTKRAISRIAKEGRKYGSSLCVVSQRPGDLDPTILSQCSTLFTMRLSNENDQRIVQSALSDASLSVMAFLPTLGTRECIVFGEGITMPSRILLNELSQKALPRGHSPVFEQAWAEETADDQLLSEITTRWRPSGYRPKDTEIEIEEDPAIVAQRAPIAPGSSYTTSRAPSRPSSLLKVRQ